MLFDVLPTWALHDARDSVASSTLLATVRHAPVAVARTVPSAGMDHDAAAPHSPRWTGVVPDGVPGDTHFPVCSSVRYLGNQGSRRNISDQGRSSQLYCMVLTTSKTGISGTLARSWHRTQTPRWWPRRTSTCPPPHHPPCVSLGRPGTRR